MAEKLQIIKHPDFVEQEPKYKLWEDLCEGGDRVENNEVYLPQHAYESNPQYAIRKRLATYKNHARPIVAVFTSSAWRKPPKRELPDELEQYRSNVDMRGSSAGSFFRETSEYSASVGVSFLAVDTTKPPGGESPSNLDQYQKFGMRPYMVRLSARKVPAWGFDADGLAFVVVDESQSKDVDPFTKQEKVQNYKIWYRDTWELWQENDKKELFKIDDGSHPCGEVPIRPLYFRKKKDMVGESCIKDVASLLLRAYMLENALDKSLFDTAFPQQYFFGFQPDEITGYIKSSANGLVSGQPDAKTGLVEPSGQSYAALDSKVKRDEVSIGEIALRMIRPDSKVGQSAEAKKLDRQQLDSQLSVFSQNCEDTERWAWKMMLKWLKADQKVDDIVVEYNRDFDVTDISGDLLRAFGEMRRNGDLSRKTYFGVLDKAEVPLPEDFDIEEEEARINAESGGFGGASNLGRSILTGT
jgi:hypothetical protein